MTTRKLKSYEVEVAVTYFILYQVEASNEEMAESKAENLAENDCWEDGVSVDVIDVNLIEDDEANGI